MIFFLYYEDYNFFFITKIMVDLLISGLFTGLNIRETKTESLYESGMKTHNYFLLTVKTNIAQS